MPSAANKPETRIPLTGLLDVALEALLAEFRVELGDSEFSDIRPTHGCVFRFVKDDGMRLTELAELASMTKQSAGEVVDDLAGKGYVERIPHPEDKRAKLICLTERGKEAQRHGFGLFGKVEERWIERYGRDRIVALRETLEAIAATEAPQAVPELARTELANVS